MYPKSLPNAHHVGSLDAWLDSQLASGAIHVSTLGAGGRSVISWARGAPGGARLGTQSAAVSNNAASSSLDISAIGADDSATPEPTCGFEKPISPFATSAIAASPPDASAAATCSNISPLVSPICSGKRQSLLSLQLRSTCSSPLEVRRTVDGSECAFASDQLTGPRCDASSFSSPARFQPHSNEPAAEDPDRGTPGPTASQPPDCAEFHGTPDPAAEATCLSRSHSSAAAVTAAAARDRQAHPSTSQASAPPVLHGATAVMTGDAATTEPPPPQQQQPPPKAVAASGAAAAILPSRALLAALLPGVTHTVASGGGRVPGDSQAATLGGVHSTPCDYGPCDSHTTTITSAAATTASLADADAEYQRCGGSSNSPASHGLTFQTASDCGGATVYGSFTTYSSSGGCFSSGRCLLRLDADGDQEDTGLSACSEPLSVPSGAGSGGSAAAAAAAAASSRGGADAGNSSTGPCSFSSSASRRSSFDVMERSGSSSLPDAHKLAGAAGRVPPLANALSSPTHSATSSLAVCSASDLVSPPTDTVASFIASATAATSHCGHSRLGLGGASGEAAALAPSAPSSAALARTPSTPLSEAVVRLLAPAVAHPAADTRSADADACTTGTPAPSSLEATSIPGLSAATAADPGSGGGGGDGACLESSRRGRSSGGGKGVSFASLFSTVLVLPQPDGRVTFYPTSPSSSAASPFQSKPVSQAPYGSSATSSSAASTFAASGSGDAPADCGATPWEATRDAAPTPHRGFGLQHCVSLGRAECNWAASGFMQSTSEVLPNHGWEGTVGDSHRDAWDSALRGRRSADFGRLAARNGSGGGSSGGASVRNSITGLLTTEIEPTMYEGTVRRGMPRKAALARALSQPVPQETLEEILAEEDEKENGQ